MVDPLQPIGRTRVLGIVNVTPDSFSDGGLWFDTERAVARGRRLAAEGADIVDVGGESTRPGAERVSASEELRRVLPVIEALVSDGIAVSVDTMRATVADASIEAGAALVNDVSGGLADPDMLGVVADAGVAYICMHWRGHSATMQSRARYDDVVAEVSAELAERAAACAEAGIAPERVILDPGIGFAKTAAQNWELVARVGELAALGHPLLMAVSRKRFLGELLESAGELRAADGRDDATLAITVEMARRRLWGVRTHAAAAHRDAIAVVERLREVNPER